MPDFAEAATVCANLPALYPALWLFTEVHAVERTNNHADRILRQGVPWRKNAYRWHSPAGCRFAERILTVVQSLRLHSRPVLDYLYRAIVAHRAAFLLRNYWANRRTERLPTIHRSLCW